MSERVKGRKYFYDVTSRGNKISEREKDFGKNFKYLKYLRKGVD